MTEVEWMNISSGPHLYPNKFLYVRIWMQRLYGLRLRLGCRPKGFGEVDPKDSDVVHKWISLDESITIARWWKAGDEGQLNKCCWGYVSLVGMSSFVSASRSPLSCLSLPLCLLTPLSSPWDEHPLPCVFCPHGVLTQCGPRSMELDGHSLTFLQQWAK